MGAITWTKVLAVLLLVQLYGGAVAQTIFVDEDGNPIPVDVDGNPIFTNNNRASPDVILTTAAPKSPPKKSPAKKSPAKKSPPKSRTSPKKSPPKKSPPKSKRSPPKRSPPKASPRPSPKRSPAPKPSPAPLRPGQLFPLRFPAQTPPLCKQTFKKGQQCGGSGGSCASWPHHVKKCPDSYWNQACCERGTSCQRVSAAWWECKPVVTETTRSWPKPADLPPNNTLTTTVIDSLQKNADGTPKHRYILVKHSTDWFTAEAICQYYYGLHLASIHDIAEMWRVNNRCLIHVQEMCWIGANDLRQRGIFKYTDGSSWDWAWWQQNEGPSWTTKQRCVALQDGFQTHPCEKSVYNLAPACQIF